MKEETGIQNTIKVDLSPYGICIRMQSGLFYTQYGARVKVGFDGLSDLLFVGDQRYFGKPLIAFIEVKTDEGKPTKEQLDFIALMKEYGYIAGIARNSEEAKKLIGVIE